MSIPDTKWLSYSEYILNTIWMQLKVRGASNKVIQEISDECKEANFSEQVLAKYNLHI